MTDVETLEERVRTVERAVTDGEHEMPRIEDRAELEARLTAVEDSVERLDERASDLEAATQALRGYVGNVRSVNEDVEQRADAALAATERLERRLDDAPGDHRTAPKPTAGPRTQTGNRSHDRRDQPETTANDHHCERNGDTADGRSTPVADGGGAEHSSETPDASVLERIRALL